VLDGFQEPHRVREVLAMVCRDGETLGTDTLRAIDVLLDAKLLARQ
jgi:hypothetical protein